MGLLRGMREKAGYAALGTALAASASVDRGVPARGRVISIRDTGTTINENPRAELTVTVTLAGREPYEATFTHTVGRLHVGRFAPGAEIPLRVDRNDLQEVSLDAEAFDRRVPEPPERTTAQPTSDGGLEALLARGTPGRARLVKVAEGTMQAPDGDPLFLFELEVTAPEGDPYETRCSHRVPAESADLILAGLEVPVAINPDEPRQVAIDWTGAGLAAPGWLHEPAATGPAPADTGFRLPTAGTSGRAGDVTPATAGTSGRAGDVTPATAGTSGRAGDVTPATAGTSGRAGDVTHEAPDSGDPIALLAGLDELRRNGVITDAEFASKKAELLRRL